MAEAYGTRPSSLLGLSDPWVSFCVDEALFFRLKQHERERLEEMQADAGHRPKAPSSVERVHQDALDQFRGMRRAARQEADGD